MRHASIVPRQPQLDLDTLRETLIYVLSDAHAPEHSGLASALQRAIEEIDSLQTAPISTARLIGHIRFLSRVIAPKHSAKPLEPAIAGETTTSSVPADEPAKRTLPSKKNRTGYGDRAYLQQAIADYLRIGKA